MQQFIRYLYEYEKEKRVRNIGFVKVELQDENCTMHIHGKGIASGEVEVFVVTFIEGNGILAEQGSIHNDKEMVHFVLRFAVEDVGGKEAFNAMGGVLLKNKNEEIYVALWGEEELQIDQMMPLKKWKEREEEKLCGEEGEMCAEEVQEEEPEQEYLPYPPKRIYEKISRKDISRLPRREWRLANNSFLLHGFYNYHHLLYIKEDENCWLGVPGIYHEKEAAAAKAFGFPQFHRLEDEAIELTEEETNTYEDFGYWCRLV